MTTQAMPIHADRILYRDDHLLIVNKRMGELVVAAGGKGDLPLYDFLHKEEPGLRVLHRLDYDTSGVLVFARTKEAGEAVRNSKFHGWEKTYRCIVAGKMQQRAGIITLKLPARTKDDLVDAVSRFRTLHVTTIASVVDVSIDTGRKHQIRRHMQSIGHPLLFDPLYGDRRKDQAARKILPYRRFFLHALRLRFPHPVTGKVLEVEAPLPKVFVEAMERLR